MGLSLPVVLVRLFLLFSLGCFDTVTAVDPAFVVPRPDMSTPSGSVSEDEAATTSILTLEGMDSDADTLSFSIVTQEPNNPPFVLNSGSGLLQVPNGLNAEATLQFNFTFGVNDGSTTVNSVQYIVYITDVNEFAPSFAESPYYAYVPESISTGDSVLTVTATDSDASPPNNDVTFSMSGDGSNNFAIDDEGSITLTPSATLNYTSQSRYNLTLIVTDKGSTIQMSSSVMFIVTLETGPEFTTPADLITFEDINEDIGPDYAIFTFTATDEDSAPTALAYNIVDVDPSSGNSLFTMDGAILKTSASVTDTTFDVEAPGAIQSYTLNMRVTDGKYNATTNLTLRIQDVNDKAPTFTETSYSISIPEFEETDIEILTVTATDDDISSPNNEFTFSLSGDDSDHFAINETGSISVASPSKLNFTSKPSYSLTITVIDKATTTRLSSSVTLSVTLETGPEFTTPADLITSEDINEDTGPDYAIFTFTATDEDSAPTALAYNIVNVDPSSGTSLFTMDGAILKTSASVTDTTFDVEASGAIQSYILDMRVTDGKYNATTNLTLRIQDVNDKAPTFTETSYSISIPEFEETDIEILTVTATDDDISSPNNGFTFSLSGDDSDHFAINETGSISVASPSKLNFTSKPSYSLTITVIDKATTTRLSSSVTLSVTLETGPEFTTPADLITSEDINEDTGPDYVIFTFTATDEDSAPTALAFNIVNVDPSSGTSLFTMDGAILKTSAIVTDTTFDVEASGAIQSYILDMRVTDGKYNATTKLTLRIEDVNDKTPTFTETSYSISIPEFEETDIGILTVTATDDDISSPNNEFTFSLSGDDSDHFAINETGSISVSSPSKLNFTSKPSYSLTITVIDKTTTTTLSSSVTLSVTLETGPEFTTPADLITSEDINEDTGPDYVIFTFTATDEDSAPTALAFNIVNVDPSSGTSLFTMDGAILKTSAIVTDTTFDVEASGAIQSYTLNMRVTDGKYNATTKLTLRIEDVNDKTPTFTETSYSISIPEFEETDIGILTVTATDDDISSPNNEFTFSLSGDDSDHFAINETGSISVSSPSKLNFTSKPSYSLTITVIDKTTTTTLSSSVTLSVTLETDVDNCNPNPCTNSGECTGGVTTYSCNCTRGWQGINCTKACSSNTYGWNCADTCQCNDTRLAANTETQKCDEVTGACKCNAQWTGDSCETDVNECTQDSSLCNDQPRHVCQNNIGGYECVCETEFEKDATHSTCVAAYEIAVRSRFTNEPYTNCDVGDPSSYKTKEQAIRTAELGTRFPSANHIKVFDISCGSITYELAVVINDTDVARARLAVELKQISNGKPLVLDGQSTVTTSLTVAERSVDVNTMADASDQVCYIYTSFTPCGSSYECKVTADGTPFCEKKDTDDDSLTLGLAIGIPLGVLAIMLCVVLVICYCRMRSKGNDLERYKSSRRHKKEAYRRNDLPTSTFTPMYWNSKPKSLNVPPIGYNYQETLPTGSRNSMAASSTFNYDNWLLYSPTNGSGLRNGYNQSERSKSSRRHVSTDRRKEAPGGSKFASSKRGLDPGTSNSPYNLSKRTSNSPYTPSIRTSNSPYNLSTRNYSAPYNVYEYIDMPQSRNRNSMPVYGSSKDGWVFNAPSTRNNPSSFHSSKRY